MKTAFRLFWVFFLLSFNLWAGDGATSWYTQDANKKLTLNVELFLSSTCPHCHKADEFFSSLSKSNPYLHVQRNIINEDKNALIRFNQLLSEQHMDDFAVPSIYFCGSRWLGFASAETTGKDLLHAINYCKQQIEKDGTLTPATIDTLRHWANANKFDSGMVEKPSTFSYIVTIAITDAFSPCAFFCFAGFLAFLFLGENHKTRISASLLFILAMAITHYWQQVHTSSFYELLPWLRGPAFILGAVAVYFVVQFYKRKSTRYWLLSLAFLFGFMVTVYQQTCVMNWSYIFEQWLNNQNVSSLHAGFYQLLYQALYILPLVIILIFYLTLFKVKRFVAMQPRLVPIGLLFILAIAACLIAYPLLLANLTVSVFTILILGVCGRFINLT